MIVRSFCREVAAFPCLCMPTHGLWMATVVFLTAWSWVALDGKVRTLSASACALNISRPVMLLSLRSLHAVCQVRRPQTFAGQHTPERGCDKASQEDDASHENEARYKDPASLEDEASHEDEVSHEDQASN